MATEEGASLLKGCTVYVWALDGGDVMTYGGLTAKVKGFGGKVVSRLTKEVTHIIFHRKHSPLPRERLQEDDAIRHFYRTVRVQDISNRHFNPVGSLPYFHLSTPSD